ncbi:MAG TPA: sigma-70 family RNA polymerase sigma factor, partial [Trebonia sp.]|nr:sigma-70 family RNA polymerase sigma factor [Trebonia sp.]
MFIADLHPGLGAYLAQRYEGGYDAPAGRTRFLLWLATHVDGVDTLRDYLARAARAAQLSAEAEASLARQARAGQRAEEELAADGSGELAAQARAELERVAQEGVEAGNQLLEANLHLVVAIAKRFVDRRVPFVDLIQAGHEGLVRALQKYDPATGYRFSTYTTWWIRQAITRATAGKPPAPPQSLDRLTEAERHLLQTLGRSP